MSRFAIRPAASPPAWRRTLGLAILILGAAAAGVITARLTP